MAGIGTATTRLDGPAKVTGAAHYGSDVPIAKPAYGVLVTSAIARGRITAIDEAPARAVKGVIEIFTHQQHRQDRRRQDLRRRRLHGHQHRAAGLGRNPP